MSRRGRPQPARLETCPFCNVAVRGDRLGTHVLSVHPTQRPTPAQREVIEAAKSRAASASRGTTRRRFHGWTPRRAATFLLAAALVGLGLYAVVLKSPGPMTTGGTQAARVGGPAPDFTFIALDGSTQRLSDYARRPVVLWFIATWCNSCQVGTQLFAQTYYADYHEAGVILLEVMSYNDLGQPGPGIDSFASQYGYSGQPGWVLGSASSEGTSLYNPYAYLDLYYVIGSGGVILASSPNLPPAFASALQVARGS